MPRLKEVGVRWVSDGGKLLRAVRAAASVHVGRFAGKLIAATVIQQLVERFALPKANGTPRERVLYLEDNSDDHELLVAAFAREV